MSATINRERTENSTNEQGHLRAWENWRPVLTSLGIWVFALTLILKMGEIRDLIQNETELWKRLNSQTITTVTEPIGTINSGENESQ